MKVFVVIGGRNIRNPDTYVHDLSDAEHTRVVVTDDGKGEIRVEVRECNAEGVQLYRAEGGGKFVLTPDEETELVRTGHIAVKR